MEQRLQFYLKKIEQYITNKNASILVVAGGKNDAFVFNKLQFTNVLITNITPTPLYPVEHYDYKQANALHLPFEDKSFDYVIISAALHHLPLPHLGLTEIYRVAKNAAILIEATDNALMRLMVTMDIAEEYELSAVKRLDNKAGGINNSEVPNFIYRWTANEIRKTIQTYAPHVKHQIEISYGLTLPYSMEMANKWYFKLGYYLLKAILTMYPSQQNLCCAFIPKPKEPENIQDWLK